MVFLAILAGLGVLFFSSFDTVLADLHNVTVDNTDSSIVYKGTWRLAMSPLDYGGSHNFADTQIDIADVDATATFMFNGNAIYYMSPVWPYEVNNSISVDGGAPEVIHMVDPQNSGPFGGGPTGPSQILWGKTGLSNGQHTIVLSIAQPDGIFVVVDAFIYTTLDTTPTRPTASPSIFSLNASSSSGSSSSMSPRTIAIISVICGLAALGGIVAAVALLLRRRRKRIDPVTGIKEGEQLLHPFLSGPSTTTTSPNTTVPVSAASTDFLRSQYGGENVNEFGYVPPTAPVFIAPLVPNSHSNSTNQSSHSKVRPDTYYQNIATVPAAAAVVDTSAHGTVEPFNDPPPRYPSPAPGIDVPVDSKRSRVPRQ